MTEVVVRSIGGLTNEIVAGGHVITADEPRDEGGADAGPSPYTLLLGALGACTSMTLRLYADRKGLPLERVDVALAHERIHAADCADCETRDVRIDRISVRLRLYGPLDVPQRQRLLVIARKCPVYRTLTGDIRIEETLRQPEVTLGA